MLKKLSLPILFLSGLIIFITSCNHQRSEKPRILVFSKTAGFHHSSIPVGIKAIQDLGAANGFDVDTTTDASMFEEDTLKKYAALVFLNTTGDLLSAGALYPGWRWFCGHSCCFRCLIRLGLVWPDGRCLF